MENRRKALALACIAFVGGCSAPATSKISAAEEILRRQVASDIEITIDPSSVKLNEPPGNFYYACGISTLNRPGDGPLALNNAQQRFITTVNRSGAGGGTQFDGSSSPEGKAEFQSEWAAKCQPAT
jgi:hypothetical protein